jgi:hypothetical protein
VYLAFLISEFARYISKRGLIGAHLCFDLREEHVEWLAVMQVRPVLKDLQRTN